MEIKGGGAAPQSREWKEAGRWGWSLRKKEGGASSAPDSEPLACLETSPAALATSLPAWSGGVAQGRGKDTGWSCWWCWPFSGPDSSACRWEQNEPLCLTHPHCHLEPETPWQAACLSLQDPGPVTGETSG